MNQLNSKFIQACSSGNFSIVSKLINKISLDLVNEIGYSPLILSADNKDISNILISKGFNVDFISENGLTPLMNASSIGNVEVVKLLIENGATVNYQGNKGNTALMCATRNNKQDAIKILLDNNADASLLNFMGKSALNYAEDMLDFISMALMDHNLVTEIDNDGNNLLYRACRQQHGEAILFLIREGADYFLKNKNGESPEDILIKQRASPDFLSEIESIILTRSIADQDQGYTFSL